MQSAFFRLIVLTTLLISGLSTTAMAAEWRWLGRSSMFNNDFLGDGKDRWRSAAYSFSNIFEIKSERFAVLSNVIWELRGRGEIITPDRITVPVDPGDRPYAGYAAFAILGHFTQGRNQFSVGGELGFLGPQTGISAFHERAHKRLNLQIPRGWGGQLGNRIIPTGLFEVAHERGTTLGRVDVRFRPFLSTQAGLETFSRVGADLIIGTSIRDNYLLRDTVTGHLHTARKDIRSAGVSLLLGADLAYVVNSQLLPSSRGIRHERLRTRVRGGLQIEYRRAHVFGGLTWLGREFKEQPESQILGSLSITLQF